MSLSQFDALTEQLFSTSLGISWLSHAMIEYGEDLFDPNALEMARRVGRYEVIKTIQEIVSHRQEQDHG